LQDNFDFRPVEIKPRHEAIMLIGPPGVGKTMTAAKMATEAVLAHNNVSVITSDTYKAGGVEQLQSFTDILSIKLQRADTPAELREAIDNVPDDHVIIVDTAGINPYDTAELQQLGKLIACSRRLEPLLVTNAGMDVNEAADIATNFSYLGTSKLAVTKIDATRRLGGVLTAAHAGNLAFSHFSRHAGAAEGLEAVRPAKLAAMMLYFPNNMSKG
jgi:flagellar biosynthesis protein FlhF